MPTTTPQQKKRSFSAFEHLQQIVSWSTASLIALGVLLVPSAAALPAFSFTRRNDHNAAMALRRVAPACTNYTAQPQPGFLYIDNSTNKQEQPSLGNRNNITYITYTSTATTTPNVMVNAILENDVLLLPGGSNAVSTSSISKFAPKAIPTQNSLVIPFYLPSSYSYFSKVDPNTLTLENNVNGYPQEELLSYTTSGGLNMSPSGVALDNGGHLEAFTSQEVFLNTYQVIVRAFQADDITPVFTDLPISTNASYTTANPIIAQSQIAPGNFTGIWQRQLSVTKPNELVSRRFNFNGTTVTFTDLIEKSFSTQVPALVGQNCFNAQNLDRADGSTVITFQNQNINTGVAAACFLIVDNTGTVTNFQTIPVTITADTTQFIPIGETSDGFAVAVTGTASGKQKIYAQRFYANGSPKDATPILLDPNNLAYAQRSPAIINRGNGLLTVAGVQANPTTTTNDDIFVQHISEAFNLICPNTAVTEGAGPTLLNCYLAPLFNTPSSITVTLNPPVNAGTVSTCNGQMTFTGTYDEVNNFLALNFQPAYLYKTSFAIPVTFSAAGMTTVNTAIPVTMKPIDYPPVLNLSGFMQYIAQGLSNFINYTLTDVDTPNDQLIVTPGGVPVGSGSFQQINTTTGAVIANNLNQWTEAQRLGDDGSGQGVQFLAAKSGPQPAFTLTAQDATTTLPAQTANINYQADQLTVPVNILPLNQDQTVVFDATILLIQSNDPRRTPGGTVTAVRNGFVQKQIPSGSGTWVNLNVGDTFLQTDIGASDIRAVSNSANALYVTFTPFDGTVTLQDFNLNVEFTAKPVATAKPAPTAKPTVTAKENSSYTTADLENTLIGIAVGLPVTAFVTYLGYAKLDTDRQNIDPFANMIVRAGKLNIHTFNTDEKQDSFRLLVRKLLKSLRLEAEVTAFVQQSTGKLECTSADRSKADTHLKKYAEIIALHLKSQGFIADKGIGTLSYLLPNFAFKRLVGVSINVSQATKVLPSETEIDTVMANTATLIGAIHKDITAYKNKGSTSLLRAFTMVSLGTNSSDTASHNASSSTLTNGSSPHSSKSSTRSSPPKDHSAGLTPSDLEMSTLDGAGNTDGTGAKKSRKCLVM